jgi:hypothetical protein
MKNPTNVVRVCILIVTGVFEMRNSLFIGLSFGFALIGCDGGTEPTDTDEDTEPTLTCDVVSDPNFCWLTSVEEAYACVDAELDGVFDATRSTCTYPDGVTVAFDEPVPEDLFGDETYYFSFRILASDSTECAEFVDTATSTSLTTAAGTFTSTPAGLFGLELECPAGDVYQTNDGFSLMDCDGAVLPGYMYSGGVGSVSFSLMGSPEGTFGLINCAPPE